MHSPPAKTNYGIIYPRISHGGQTTVGLKHEASYKRPAQLTKFEDEGERLNSTKKSHGVTVVAHISLTCHSRVRCAGARRIYDLRTTNKLFFDRRRRPLSQTYHDYQPAEHHESSFKPEH
ncbi:hypothetical protein HW555_000147 [Spodoptera exigua]|uniref:Uncharacterized protein n=1 Tax=Spodoptera exigua TaxID=7107 RepID=A0A835GS05_SPOEX|nr:hypothetical protein HW555_000147 [Spodoptera exigua]